MKVYSLVYGYDAPNFSANSYVVSDEDNNAVIIDPSANNNRLLKLLEANQLKPLGVLLTHGHFDHIGGIPLLLEKYKIPVYIHEDDADLLVNPHDNCSWFENRELILDIKPVVVMDEEEIRFTKELAFKVIHTPFHTRGSVCYYLKNNSILFSGDTLFKMSIGREDLPSSCPRYRENSLDKLRKLPDDTKVYPGHGDITTIKKEKSINTMFKN